VSRTILALIGPKGCGKSTLATQLTEQANFVRVPFAGPLKAMIWTLLRLQQVTPDEIEAMLNGDLKETPTRFLADRTPRWAMQTLGTEWRNLIDKELWTRVWHNSVTSFWFEQNIVVEDTRFLHEEAAVRKLGGHILRIFREDQTTETDPHISEQEFRRIEFDKAILNVPNRPNDMIRQVFDYLPSIISGHKMKAINREITTDSDLDAYFRNIAGELEK